MLPATTVRVADQTPFHINQRIRRATDNRVARYAAEGPDAVRRRLTELDYEWDMERTLETNAAAVSLVGLSLGAVVDRRWFILPQLWQATSRSRDAFKVFGSIFYSRVQLLWSQ